MGTTSYKSMNVGIMFLNEVALGKQHIINQDDSTIIKPPKGYDSVLAKGRTEPDTKFDKLIELDGKKVIGTRFSN